MTWKDWENFKKATDCHICNKSLIKDEFLDSLTVWNIEEAGEEGSEKWIYWGQGHKKCFYMAQKEQKLGVQRLERLEDEKDQLEAKSGNMFVLRRIFDEEKLQRCSKGPLPHNGQVPRSRAQRM